MCSNKFVRPKNDTLLRALLREPTEYTPIWLMRQAEYRDGQYVTTWLVRLLTERGGACFNELDVDDLKMVTIADFGGWNKVQEKHFADGGLFDRIYTK